MFGAVRILGPITPGDAAALIGLPATTATDVVQRLVDRGLIERVANPRDGRSYPLRITAKGEEGWGAGRPPLEGMLERLGAQPQPPAGGVGREPAAVRGDARAAGRQPRAAGGRGAPRHPRPRRRPARDARGAPATRSRGQVCIVSTTADATRSGEGEGEQLWFVGTWAAIRAPGEASGGRFALIEFLFPHLASPPLHTHPQDESYVVLDGRLTVVAGERRFELEPEAVGVVPMGVPHTFRVDSASARV